MVATAAPPLLVAAASEAEEVGRMCQQLRQCVGSCQLDGTATSSGRAGADDPAALTAAPMQVNCP